MALQENASLSANALKETLEAIKVDYAELNDGDVLYEKISTRLVAIYDNPPITECQLCLDKSIILSIEDIRMIIFDPSLDQVKYYPMFLKNVNNNGDINTNSKTKSIFLTLFYLVHRYVYSTINIHSFNNILFIYIFVCFFKYYVNYLY